MKQFWWFLLSLLLMAQIPFNNAWKPIVGQQPAATAKSTSTSFTSSFSLQQSHPEYGADSGETLYSIDGTSKELLGSDKKMVPLTDEVLIPALINFQDIKYGYRHSGSDVASSYEEDNTCSVKKYALNHDGVVQFNNKIPSMNQFTICFWMRFTNHSGDHVILTYATDEEPREIQFWVANARNSSFISMAIKGQQMYRLNSPLKVRQWHHTCSSWNGKTGEWQVWAKGERIGRGFHNSLVGHKIPGHGKLFSGGPSATGKVCEGLHFEVTLIQVYCVALSAGKAHRDHKHHHVHHFNHEGQEIQITTKPPPSINRPLPMHSLLANGQIPTRVRINLALPTQAVDTSTPAGQAAQQEALTIHTNFANGQINAGSRLIAQQLIGLNHNLQAGGPVTTQAVNRQTFFDPSIPTQVQYVDETETKILFKRHAANSEQADDSKSKSARKLNSLDKNVKKRGLIVLNDGTLVDDPLLGESVVYKYDGLADYGGQQFKNELNTHMHNLEDEISEHDREPAEEEVRAVMALCGSCDTEPFQGAIIFAWKDAQEQLDNALKGYSVGRCGNF